MHTSKSNTVRTFPVCTYNTMTMYRLILAIVIVICDTVSVEKIKNESNFFFQKYWKPLKNLL